MTHSSYVNGDPLSSTSISFRHYLYAVDLRERPREHRCPRGVHLPPLVRRLPRPHVPVDVVLLVPVNVLEGVEAKIPATSYPNKKRQLSEFTQPRTTNLYPRAMASFIISE